MEISTEKLGANIRRERERRRLSIEELAERIEESAESVIRIENGKKRVTIALLLSFCWALDVTPNELLEGVKI